MVTFSSKEKIHILKSQKRLNEYVLNYHFKILIDIYHEDFLFNGTIGCRSDHLLRLLHAVQKNSLWDRATWHYHSIFITTKLNQIIICLVTDKDSMRTWSCANNFFDPILAVYFGFSVDVFSHWIISKEIDQLVGFSVWKGFPLTSLLKSK